MPEAQQTITREKFRTLKHPIQRRRFALALFFSLLLFPLIGASLALGTIALIVPAFAFLLWLGSRTLFAYFLGNCILVSPLNYPRVYRIGEDLKATIGYAKPVNIFVYEEGHFNAYLVKFFFYRRAVFLNSELLEAGVTDDELTWTIGRFIGYLRTRREAAFWGWTIRAAEHLVIFNLFILPYERAMALTGDRIALEVINGNISSAVSAMQKMLVGRLLGYSVNPAGLIDQQRLVKGDLFAFLARIWKSFPHTTTRYVDLIDFARQAYPEQFARFEAENPGMPPDLPKLAALPGVAPSADPDPILLPLLAALLLFAMLIGGAIAAVHIASQEHSATNNSSSLSVPANESTTAPAPAPVAQSYTSSAGKFRVQFPSTPALSSKVVPLETGDSITLHSFTAEVSDTVYVVVYNDYPAGYIGDDRDSFLKDLAQSMAKAMDGTIDNDVSVGLNGNPGHSSTIITNDGQRFALSLYLHGRRLYRVMVGGSSQAPDNGQFQESFEIL